MLGENTLRYNSPEILHLCKRDKRLAKLIMMVGEISYTNHSENCYAFMVHEIIEQVLSVKVGRKIYERLERLCAGEITPQRVMSLSDDQIMCFRNRLSLRVVRRGK